MSYARTDYASRSYAASMAAAQGQAERGASMHTVGAVSEAWNVGCEKGDLPPDAEEQARKVFALANSRRESGPYPAVEIDITYVLGNLRRIRDGE